MSTWHLAAIDDRHQDSYFPAGWISLDKRGLSVGRLASGIYHPDDQ